MPLKTLAAFAAVFAASASVFAAEPVDVSPLVNDRTIAVGQIDLAQLKLRPAFDWAIDTAKRGGVPADMIAPMEQGAAAVALIGQPSVDGLRRAGVSTLGLVVQLSDGPNINTTPILLLAVPKPADSKQVIAALAPLGMRSGEKGGLMVFSPNLPPGVLAGMRPTERPDLAVKTNASALATASAFSDTVKAELLARTPRPDPELEAVVRDVKRYEVRIDTADGPRVGITAEATSPEAAANLLKLITKDRPGPEGKTWASIVKTLPWKVEGSNLSVSARQPEIDAVIKSVAPAAGAARVTAQQVQSMSNMRQLMVGTMLYANDNGGTTPTTLDELVQQLAKTSKTPAATLSTKLLTNPARPELGTSGYVYVRPAEKVSKIKNALGTVALYEAGEFGDGIAVGFWDGHVERITDEAKFKAMLGDRASAMP